MIEMDFLCSKLIPKVGIKVAVHFIDGVQNKPIDCQIKFHFFLFSFDHTAISPTSNAVNIFKKRYIQIVSF